MSSVVEKARMIRGCTMIRAIVKICFRVGGSCCKWPWLARIIRGVSQQDKTNSGEDVWSMPVYWVRFLYG